MQKIHPKLQRVLDGVLRPDEPVQGLRIGMIVRKKGRGKRLAKSVGWSALITVPLSFIGFAGFSAVRPIAVWIVVTPERVILIGMPNGKKTAGDVLFADERPNLLIEPAITAMKPRILVRNRSTGEEVFTLGFGLRAKLARGVAADLTVGLPAQQGQPTES